jgi:hypothetical protein
MQSKTLYGPWFLAQSNCDLEVSFSMKEIICGAGLVLSLVDLTLKYVLRPQMAVDPRRAAYGAWWPNMLGDMDCTVDARMWLWRRPTTPINR